MKIPELGDYYANEWTDSVSSMEQELGLGSKSASAELKRNGLSA